MNLVCHQFPKKQEKKPVQDGSREAYTKRLTEKEFVDYETALPAWQANQILIEQANSGVNYRTGRKILVGGPTYCKLMKPWRQHDNIVKRVKQELGTQSKEEYLAHSAQLKSIWENSQAAEDAKVDAYNMQVDEVIGQVKQLTSWDGYVEFQGKKYGLPPKEGHVTHDCDGKILSFSTEVTCSCSNCENWGGCSRPGTYYYNQCNKCHYKTNWEKSWGGGKWSHEFHGF